MQYMPVYRTKNHGWMPVFQNIRRPGQTLSEERAEAFIRERAEFAARDLKNRGKNPELVCEKGVWYVLDDGAVIYAAASLPVPAGMLPPYFVIIREHDGFVELRHVVTNPEDLEDALLWEIDEWIGTDMGWKKTEYERNGTELTVTLKKDSETVTWTIVFIQEEKT